MPNRRQLNVRTALVQPQFAPSQYKRFSPCGYGKGGVASVNDSFCLCADMSLIAQRERGASDKPNHSRFDLRHVMQWGASDKHANQVERDLLEGRKKTQGIQSPWKQDDKTAFFLECSNPLGWGVTMSIGSGSVYGRLATWSKCYHFNLKRGRTDHVRLVTTCRRKLVESCRCIDTYRLVCLAHLVLLTSGIR